jgi:hypothetical protein
MTAPAAQPAQPAPIDWGAFYDQWAAGQAGNPYSQVPTDPAAAAARRAEFIRQQGDQQYQAAAAQRNQETNAYQIARDAALGMMVPGSVGANGVDYGKPVADPSAAGRAFVSSGYTGQQALADGWGTGIGAPGWQQPAMPPAYVAPPVAAQPPIPPAAPPATAPPVVQSTQAMTTQAPTPRPRNPTATPNIPGQPVTDFTYPVGPRPMRPPMSTTSKNLGGGG